MGYRLKLTPARQEHLSRVIGTALEKALQDRAPMEREWIQEDALYEGKTQQSNFPYTNAPNYPVPLGETYANAVSSRLTDTIHQPEPTFTVRNRTDPWVDAAKAAQDLLEYVQRDVIKLREFTERCTKTLSKHGTAFGFCPWQVLLEKNLKYDITADEVGMTIDTRIAGPFLSSPMLEDVVFPMETQSLRNAPWRGQRFYLSDDDIDVRVFSGVYEQAMVDRIQTHKAEQFDERKKALLVAQGWSVSDAEPFNEIWEWWGSTKLPGHKYASNFIVPFHLPTKTPLSLLVNFYPHQFNPFFSANFERPEYGVYGRGVCKMIKNGSREVDDLHRNRVLNAMIANTKCFKVRKGSSLQHWRSLEIWPGKIIPVDNMEDMQEFAIGEVYPSTMNEEMLTRRTMEQQVGLIDFSLTGGGGESLKRVGATPALVAVQESGRMLNYRLNHLRMMYSEMAAWLLEMYGHFRPMEVFLSVCGVKGTQALINMFDAPIEAVRGQMFLELTASSTTINREVDKQSDLILSQIMSQYFEKYFQLAVLLVNPQLPPPLRTLGFNLGKAMNALMSDILRDFNKRDGALKLAEIEDVIQGGGLTAPLQSRMAELGPGVDGAMGDQLATIAARAGLQREGAVIGALPGVGGSA